MLASTFALLVLAAFAAGFVDAIAGGGGLITIPALLLGGVDPLAALGTNKLQSLFGSGSASISYAAKGHVYLRKLAPTALLSFAGAVLGALGAMVLPTGVLQTLLPFLLIAIALYFALKPGLSDRDAERRISPVVFACFLVPLIGAYDGLFGPGTGSFFMLAFVTLAGYGILKATAHTKLLNFASNVGGFVVFAFSGAIVWKLGLAMGAAQFAGARLGAMFAMRFGARLIRPLLVVVCLALAAKLLLS
ncbi:UPF0721 transmembrane protein [Aureimonas sp. SA4125]|uniref:TSUP family transporter n=1 Tax=Aureimonas sp. SA4125 TaxID=2826993 RepID=UPI001CC587B0|nr:TSUP family transporter [Aureimonas sp. SA4125]BDA82585.1 UPF0721 transmembrane protein [Aureimonas sp. SA4125]